MCGQILFNHITKRLSVYTYLNKTKRSFDILNQDLASIYQNAIVDFEINENDEACLIEITAL